MNRLEARADLASHADGTMTAVRNAFFRIGWLLPVILPLAQVGGRALANVLAGVYLIWAVAAVLGMSARVSRLTLALYLAVPAAFLLSLWGAHDVSGGFRDWFKIATHISVFYFTLIALQQRASGAPELARAWGVVAVVLVMLLYLVLPVQLMDPQFQPTQALKEDNLPFLLPFGLCLLSLLGRPALRWTAIGLFAAAALGYVVFSEGRAALLAMAVGLLVYGVVTVRMRWRWALGLAAALLVLGIGFGYSTFFRGMDEAGTVTSALDRFTSARTVIWRHAVDHPPENLLIGVGVGNLGEDNPVLQISDGLAVGHLHNVLLDVWYETGLIGLAALLVFLVHVMVRTARAWPALDGSARQYGGLALAGVAAIFTGALLSFSYGSWQFDVYMFMLLAVLVHLAETTTPAREIRP